MTIITPDPKGTLHTFNGRGVRKVTVRYANVDTLPLPLSFSSKDKRQVRFDGMRHVVLTLDLEVPGGHFDAIEALEKANPNWANMWPSLD